MRYIDNWIAELQAPLLAAETSLPILAPALDRLDLGAGGEYRLTIVGSLNPLEQDVYEFVLVSEAGVSRGASGTVARDWPAGALIYCSLPAVQIEEWIEEIASLEARIDTLEEGGGGGGIALLGGIDDPVDAPTGPSIYTKKLAPYGAWIAIYKSDEYWAWERLALHSDIPEAP